MKLSEIRIDIKNEKQIKKLFLVILFTAILTYIVNEIPDYINNIKVWRVVTCVINIVLVVPALVAYFTDKKKISDLFCKGKFQYFYGILMGIFLFVIVNIIPLAFGINMIGTMYIKNASIFIRMSIFYLLIIGPTEEFIFRVYIQDSLVDLFGKYKAFAPLVAGALFGVWHLICGNWIQAAITTVLGCIWGYSKFCVKGCTYMSIALSHGLYDYLIFLAKFFF